MRKIVALWISAFLLSSLLFSQSAEDLLKDADLLLDMMEYESAIAGYLKALDRDPHLPDLRKRIAYAYFQLGKMDEALNYLKKELTLFPDNSDAYDFLAYILYKLNKLNEKDILLEKFGFPQKLDLENPHIGGLGCFILALHFKEIKDYNQARKFFKKAIEKRYEPLKCSVQLIDIELVQQKLDIAREVLDEAIRLYGISAEFFFLNGLRYSEKIKTNIEFLWIAIRYFNKVLELKPSFKEALFNLACLSYNFDDFKKASNYFEEFLELDPENSEVRFYLDCCLKKIDKSLTKELKAECPKEIPLTRDFLDNPDREYRYSSKNDRDFVLQNINYLGLEFIRNGKYHEAIGRFRNALKIYAECPEANFNLGMVFFWLQNFKEAERHALIALRRRDFFGRLPAYIVQKISREKPDFIRKSLRVPLSDWTFDAALKEGNHFLEAYDLVGNIYFKKEDYERSTLAFQKVIEINPEDAMGHYNLGCAFAALKDWENAEVEWKKAIHYEEKLKKTEERRKISEDELQVSILVFKRAVSFQAHKSLGRLYLERNFLDKAGEELEEAIKIEEGDQESLYSLGKIYQAKNDKKKAIFYFEKYLYLGGKEEAEVKEILKQLKKK
mgnify:CR=1 FL=1